MQRFVLALFAQALAFVPLAQAQQSLHPCALGYEAEVCASAENPGFEYIPLDSNWLFTGEELVGEQFVFRVEVEIETGLDTREVLAEVEAVLGDYRGWTGDGSYSFRHMVSEPADLVVMIASPETVMETCLMDNPDVSCRIHDKAVINVDRWREAVPHWTEDLGLYRAYVLNHEIGHFLGFGHVPCPGEGELAPVMLQQTLSLRGCRPNGWVFDG